MRPRDVGVLFDELAERGVATTVHMSRSLDIAPDAGTDHDIAGLAGLVRAAAGWIAAAGVRPGERVAIVKDNHWDYDLLAFAAVRAGAVPALISALLPAETMQILLKRLEPALLVTTSGVLAETGAGLTSLARRTLCLDRAHRTDAVPTDGLLRLDDVRGHELSGPRSRHDDAPLVINHTSGTTGTPKLVVHSTTTIIRRLAGFEAIRWPILASRHDDTVASASAFTHGRTFCWTASVFCLAPRKVVIVADHSPEVAGPLLRAHPPTTVEGLPATFVRWMPLAAGAHSPFRDVRLYVSTYDAIHPPAVRAFLAASRRRGALWVQGWGQTETGPLTFRFLTRRSLAAGGQRHPTTRDAGRPILGRTRLRVVDPETFRPVPRGHPGVVLARTKARCLGYVGEPERFATKVLGGWFNTGDIGAYTRSGSMLLIDREVDMIPGLSCVELEDVVDDRLAEASECVILGAPGQPPVPVVVTADGRLDRAAWQAAVADLPRLAEPIVVTPDQLPRTATGKVRRAELRERLLGGTETYGSGRWT